MRKKMKKKLSPYSSILIVEMVISLLEASLGNDQPRSVTKPLQSGSGLIALPIFPNRLLTYQNWEMSS